MKYQLTIIGFVFLLSAQVYTKTALGESWEALPLRGGSVELITIHPEHPNILFAGTHGDLYASEDQGKNWKQLFSLGSRVTLNRLYFASDERLFLATSDGLFESKNQGQSWTKLFQGLNDREQNSLSLTQDPADEKIFYLGTEGGLFQSRDDGKTWAKDTNGFARKQIQTLLADPENNQLFIANEEGLSRVMTQTKRFDRVYQTKGGIDLDIISLETDETEETDSERARDLDQVHSLILASRPSAFIAMGTARGVFVSEDEGNHWERLSLSGLKDANILDLAYSSKQNRLFAATGTGIYAYDAQMKSWKELYEGMTQTQINRIALASPAEPEILYAAGRNGLYRWVIDIQPNPVEGIKIPLDGRWPLLLHLFRDEPSIRAVQKQAIRYANVSNWKTRRWQWASRFKTLIPNLSIGKSFSKGDSIDLDRGSTSEPDAYIIGPPDTNQSWDFDLNWELSELLFNSSQTSIDSREKLMVELRDDILSEVTRLYFERRRAQAEFILNPPQDPLQHASALLRIEELTANLDSLTDGYFSKELGKIYSKRPGFQALWIFQEP